MAEWLKAHDSKSCKGNTFGGSNPLASAKLGKNMRLFGFGSAMRILSLPPFFVL